MFQFSMFTFLSEINSKRYDIYRSCPNYIPILCIGNYSRKKNSITVCLLFVYRKWGMSTLSIFFCSFGRCKLMLLFLYFAIFGFSYCRYYYGYYLILLPAAIQSQYERYETVQRIIEMNEKRIKTAQFNLSLSINHCLLCEHTTRHTFGLLRGFSLRRCCLVMIIFIDLWPVSNKRCKNFSMQFSSRYLDPFHGNDNNNFFLRVQWIIKLV